MRGVHDWADEELERFGQQAADRFGLTFAVDERPPLSDDDPTIWFAALKKMDVELAPNGVGILGAEALSRRQALIGLAQLLETITDSEREWLVSQLAD